MGYSKIRKIGRKNRLSIYSTTEHGSRLEGALKFLVWDGSNGESFEDIDDEELEHADFIMLPAIDNYPKDAYVWLSLLVAGSLSFVFVERILHTKMETHS